MRHRELDERAAALEDVYRRRYSGFRNAIAPLVGSNDAARDVVQEGFARALAHRADFRGEGSLEAWVWTITVRVARNSRAFAAYEELEDLGFLEPERDPELAQIVASLPPWRRMVIFLRYFADLSYVDIADVLGITPGAVAATIAQAHRQLRTLLRQQEGHHGQDQDRAQLGA